jgi:AmmeMemoRadiSam system protein B
VFLLGPSHHYYLSNCALSQCSTYDTPLGKLQLDLDTTAALARSGDFATMRQAADEAEHSLEMHLPYIYKMLSRAFASPADFPPLLPILVGATSADAEQEFGRILAPYLADPGNVFVVSSDFCHWGSRFRYTYYQPAEGKPLHLRSGDRAPANPRIHESIAQVDMRCMDAVETGRHDAFLDVLEETGNNVCGRHPIGVMMAAIEALESKEEGQGKFRFVQYDRSGLVDNVRDSSVSYCSAFAVF